MSARDIPEDEALEMVIDAALHDVSDLRDEVERLTRERDEARAALEHDEVYEDVLMRSQALRVERDALLAEVRAARAADIRNNNERFNIVEYADAMEVFRRLRAENEKRGLV